MATGKKFVPFGAKESKDEERKEKAMPKKAYQRGERKEGLHGKGAGRKC